MLPGNARLMSRSVNVAVPEPPSARMVALLPNRSWSGGKWTSRSLTSIASIGNSLPRSEPSDSTETEGNRPVISLGRNGNPPSDTEGRSSSRSEDWRWPDTQC
jgi:hypothetical protein